MFRRQIDCLKWDLNPSRHFRWCYYQLHVSSLAGLTQLAGLNHTYKSTKPSQPHLNLYTFRASLKGGICLLPPSCKSQVFKPHIFKLPPPARLFLCAVCIPPPLSRFFWNKPWHWFRTFSILYTYMYTALGELCCAAYTPIQCIPLVGQHVPVSVTTSWNCRYAWSVGL